MTTYPERLTITNRPNAQPSARDYCALIAEAETLMETRHYAWLCVEDAEGMTSIMLDAERVTALRTWLDAWLKTQEVQP